MSYKEKLAYHPMITAETVALIDKLLDKSLTKTQLHNRKYYCKKKKDILGVLNLAIAYEITKFSEDVLENER